MDEQRIYRAALAAWGADAQTLMVFEEMAELQKELCKAARGKDNREQIAEEIADVEIMLEQMKVLHGCAEAVAAYRESKLRRLAIRCGRTWSRRKEGKPVKPIDRIMRQNVPGYAYMKEAIPQAAEREPKKKRQQKPRTLTEIAGSGKAVLRKGVTLTQAARKLNRYEETGLAPQEVFNLIERAHNLERRVEKLERWK